MLNVDIFIFKLGFKAYTVNLVEGRNGDTFRRARSQNEIALSYTVFQEDTRKCVPENEEVIQQARLQRIQEERLQCMREMKQVIKKQRRQIPG